MFLFTSSVLVFFQNSVASAYKAVYKLKKFQFMQLNIHLFLNFNFTNNFFKNELKL